MPQSGLDPLGGSVAVPRDRGALSYTERRGQMETYFDRTAVQDTWAQLTSDGAGQPRYAPRSAPGRDQMRSRHLLSWLPVVAARIVRVLDAGCGTGALAVVAARRGARGRSRWTCRRQASSTSPASAQPIDPAQRRLR